MNGVVEDALEFADAGWVDAPEQYDAVLGVRAKYITGACVVNELTREEATVGGRQQVAIVLGGGAVVGESADDGTGRFLGDVVGVVVVVSDVVGVVVAVVVVVVKP